MKKFINIFAVAAVVFGLSACETYKVGDPDMTAVYKVDGRYIAFAMDAANPTDTLSVFDIAITNTTNNDADKAWITIGDYSRHLGYYYVDAVRFSINCNNETGTIKASSVTGSWPNTTTNAYLGQGYYSRQYYMNRYYGQDYSYTLTLDGKVTVDGVNTATGYKADKIEFTYSRTGTDGFTQDYIVKGMKVTGWAEDTAEYDAWIDMF